MGLLRSLSQWVGNSLGAFDFGGDPLPAIVARRHQFTLDMAGLRRALEEAQEACRRKDELIARLQAGETVEADVAQTEMTRTETLNTEIVMTEMVADGLTYYIRRQNALDGPFCMSCFQRNHEMNRIELAAKASPTRGVPSDWVKCVKCQVPFHSDRASRRLNPPTTAAAAPQASPQTVKQPDPAPASPQPPVRTRRPKESPVHKSASAPEPAARPFRRSTAARKKAAKDVTPPPAAPEPPSDSPSI